MLKFILGPFGGYGAGLNLVTTILVTVAGMMTVVLVLTFSGTWFQKRFLTKQNPDSRKNKKLLLIWKKYGLTGVAILTPILLTPIGGTILALSSGSPKDKIIFYMFISASFWSVVFSFAVYLLGPEVMKLLNINLEFWK